MTRHFQNEIEKLKTKILHLAAMVEEALQSAVKAITERDLAMAESVINNDSSVDALEIEVEEDCLKILALHQPVAADLRYVVAAMKINNDLERIADLAVNIAERTSSIARRGTRAVPFDLFKMLDLTRSMVRNSVDALVSSDAEVANQVCEDDDAIDLRHKEAYRVILEQLAVNPGDADYLMSLLSVSRNLERIADHATNIAEDVIYMIDGEIVRHSGGGAIR